MCSIFISGLSSRLAFWHRSQFARSVIILWSPRAQPLNCAVAQLPLLRLFFCSDQRVLSAAHDRNIRASDEFEHTQSVRDLFGEPRVARDDRDAQDFRLWGLNE